MKTKLIVLIALIFINVEAYGQLSKWLVHETNGQLHLIDFTTPSPTISNPAPGYGLGGDEEVNIMTDANNNVLFSLVSNSTTNIEVRDRNWVVMPNGNGLLGHNSTLESCIVRIPCSTNKYYIIHFQTDVTRNLYYSIVDMSLNGGFGDVSVQNTFLGTGYDEALSVSHQMPNGCRWLLTSKATGNNYEIYRFLISQTGIGSPTLIATVPCSVPAFIAHEIEISHNNTKVAMSTMLSASTSPDVVVWDFDLLSGTLSNPQNFSVSSQPVVGVEFSPDNTKIYWRTNITTDNSELGRIDLLTSTSALINSSFGRFGTLIETAGNGKLYATHNYNIDYLSEIANPDAANIASIGFTFNSIFVSSSGTRPGLPNAVDGELPGSTTTPQYINFTAIPIDSCGQYQFIDSTCLATWWEWDFGDNTFSNLQSPTHQYTSNGTFTVTHRVVACGDTLTLQQPNFININNIYPVAQFPAPAPVCDGITVNFSNNSTGAISYLWDFGDNSSSTLSAPSHLYLSPGTYQVVLTVTNSCGTSSSTQTVIVNPNPVAAITPDGPTTFCSGGSVVLTASGGVSYLWSTSATSTAISVNTSGMYTVTVTDANNCTGTTATTVTVFPIPSVTLSPPGPLSICGNNTITLTANATSSVTYQWFQNNNSVPNETGATYTTGTTGNYYVIITDVNGCTASSNIVVITQGNVGPEVSISSSLQEGCLQNTIFIGYGPQSITLTAICPSAATFLWSTGATTPSITVTSAGTYSVTVWDSSGCASPATPESQITIQVLDIRCGHGLKKIILCHVPEGNPGNPQTLCIAPPAVTYHLSLHQYDCLGPCSLYYRAENMIEAENFYVMPHPNPFNNGFNLTILSASSNSVTVNIHDMLGRIVEIYNDVTEQTLIGTKLNAGIYFAEVIQDDNRQMVQIIKSE
ncbi:MAG TPA: PKD domain-containing protein [Bacteroidia bacterium]|nr:PKD domain-containing protein [Bacteroidia bacterium]